MAAQMGGFVKLYRSNALELLQHPNAFTLLTFIALKTKWREGFSMDGLQIGEAILTERGTSKAVGMSRKQYRVALDKLEKWQFVAQIRAQSGAQGGTVVKLMSDSIYDISMQGDGAIEGAMNGASRAQLGRNQGAITTVEQAYLQGLDTPKKERRKEGKKKDVGDVSDEPKPATICDADWLKSLELNPAFEGIDIQREFGKAKLWCETNRKQLSRRRFVNWLNRAEKPIGAQPTQKRFIGPNVTL